MNKKEFKINPPAMSDVLTQQFKHIFYNRPNKIILTLADEFIRCAKEDIKSCDILYKNKKYAHSTYFLQQAAEKTSKAFVLYFGKFKKNDMITISHNSLKAFLMLLDRMSNYIVNINALYPDIKTDSSDLKELLKDTKKRNEMAKINYEGFKVMFKFYNDCKKRIKNGLEDINSFLAPFNLPKTLQKSFKNLSMEELNKEIKNKDSSQILEEYFNKENTLNYLYKALDFALLYLISAYTFPHVQFTRYPDKDIKPWNYTKEMGIVRATPELIIHLKRIISNIEN
jgi:hypothetical protein